MNKRIRYINQDIQRGISLEENIPQLFNNMADHYQVLAKVKLAMHYYTCYESYYDDGNIWSVAAQNIIFRMNNLISENILKSKSGTERETAIKNIDLLRQEIMSRMKALTIYTDIFQNFEYILNRLEYRFKEINSQVEEEEFSKEILRFIFDSEDNMIINERIKDMIGQLPVRITKQKYFDIMKESLGAYLGAEVSSFSSFLYMIRTSAMLVSEESLQDLYANLWEKKEFLFHLEYNNITKKNYEKAISMLNEATIILESETTIYFGLQEIINEVYAQLLCDPYSGMTSIDTQNVLSAAETIIANINGCFLSDNKKEIQADILDLFRNLEGVQEEISMELDIMESAFYEIGKNHRALVGSLMLEQLFQVLTRTQSLLSNSIFIELTQENEDILVDEGRIEKETIALLNDLSALFQGHDRMIARAVIANTLNKVPVFFNNHKEVMDYVTYSLERCTDSYEKAACIEIIQDLLQA